MAQPFSIFDAVFSPMCLSPNRARSPFRMERSPGLPIAEWNTIPSRLGRRARLSLLSQLSPGLGLSG
jgi:hypothetical protein